jgi:hypothetical protein
MAIGGAAGAAACCTVKPDPVDPVTLLLPPPHAVKAAEAANAKTKRDRPDKSMKPAERSDRLCKTARTLP